MNNTTSKSDQNDLEGLFSLPAMDICWMCDTEGLITHINDIVEDELGFHPKQLIGKSPAAVFGNSQGFDRLCDELLTKKTIKDRLLEVCDLDGKQCFLSISAKYVDTTISNTPCMIVWARNVTERVLGDRRDRESYLNFVDVFNSTLDGLLIVDKHTTQIIDANNMAFSILGYDLKEEPGLFLKNLTYADNTRLLDFIGKLGQSGDLRFEQTLIKADGTLIEVEFSARMMQVGDGNLFQCNLKDITLKKLNEKLEQLKKEILSIAITNNDYVALVKHCCETFRQILYGTHTLYFRYHESSHSGELTSDEMLPKAMASQLEYLDFSQLDGSDEFLNHKSSLTNISQTPFWLSCMKALNVNESITVWSHPIRESKNRLLGVFVMFFDNKATIPPGLDTSLDQFVNILAISLEKIISRKRLVANERRYRQLVENSPMAIVIHSEGKVIFINEECKRIIAVPEAELIEGFDLKTFVHASEHEHMAERLAVLYAGGSLPMVEGKLLNYYGEVIYCRIFGAPIEFEGKPAVQVVFYDISAEKKLESNHAQRNLYTRVLLELSAVGSRANNEWFLINEYCKALVDDIGFDWVWVGGSLTEQTMKSKAQMLSDRAKAAGIPDSEVLQSLDGPSHSCLQTGEVFTIQDLTQANDFQAWSLALSDKGYRSVISLPLYRDNTIFGTMNLVSMDTATFDDNLLNFLNQLGHELGNGINALALKKSRDELNEFNRLLIDSLHVVSISADLHSGAFSTSGDIQEMIGYEQEELVKILEDFSRFVHPNDIDMLKQEAEATKENEGYFDVDFRFRHKDGQNVWLNSIGRIHWKGQLIRKIVGILINVDHKKKEVIRRIKANIQGRDNERTRMARELHNSLSQILTMASLSLDGISKDVENLPDASQNMYQNAYQMVNQAIEQSRTISRDLMPSLLLDFGLVKSVNSDIGRLNQSSGTKFEFRYDDECQQRYPSEIETNLYNIIREAIRNTEKHAKASFVQIELRQHDNVLRLVIKDDGIGFDQGNASSNDSTGLATMRNRALSLGGEFFINSQEGTEVIVEVDLLRDV